MKVYFIAITLQLLCFVGAWGKKIMQIDYQACEEYQGAICVHCQEGYYLRGIDCYKDIGDSSETELPKVLPSSSEPSPQIFSRPNHELCLQWDSYGNCHACRQGSHPQGSLCLPDIADNFDDSGCFEWDANEQKCTKCKDQWFLNQQGKCQRIEETCSENNQEGQCLSCSIVSGKCSQKTMKIGEIKPGCQTWDFTNNRCIECKQQWKMNADGVCTSVAR